jgi:hypothetical protein
VGSSKALAKKIKFGKLTVNDDGLQGGTVAHKLIKIHDLS